MRHAHKLSRVTLALAAATMLFAFPGCGDDDAEDLGAKLDDAVEDAKDKAEDLADEAEDAVDGN